MQILGSPKSLLTNTATLFKSQNTENNSLEFCLKTGGKPKLSTSRLSKIAHQFSDYHLAYRARLCLMIKIANFEGCFNEQNNSFSINSQHFGQLNQQRSQQILYSFLKPKTPEETAYCNEFLNKLAIYDQNCDQILTYNEYVSFFMEVCLPALSLSNLSENSESRKTGNIIEQDFIQALRIELDLIKCTVREQELRLLFKEICQPDKTVTIQKYYEFVKGYFGREGIAAKHDLLSQLKQKHYKQIEDNNSYMRILERMSKIVFRQLHAKIIDFDESQNMAIKKVDLVELMETLFNRILRIKSIEKASKFQFSYEETLEIVITEMFIKSETNSPSQKQQTLQAHQFVQRVMKRNLNWMKIKPSKYLLQEIHQYFSKKQCNFTTSHYHKFLQDLGNVYLQKFHMK